VIRQLFMHEKDGRGPRTGGVGEVHTYPAQSSPNNSIKKKGGMHFWGHGLWKGGGCHPKPFDWLNFQGGVFELRNGIGESTVKQQGVSQKKKSNFLRMPKNLHRGENFKW